MTPLKALNRRRKADSGWQPTAKAVTWTFAPDVP